MTPKTYRLNYKSYLTSLVLTTALMIILATIAFGMRPPVSLSYLTIEQKAAGILSDLLLTVVFWYFFSAIVSFPLKLFESLRTFPDRIESRTLMETFSIPFQSIRYVGLGIDESSSGTQNYQFSYDPIKIFFQDKTGEIHDSPIINNFSISKDDLVQILQYISTIATVSPYVLTYIQNKKTVNMEEAYYEYRRVYTQFFPNPKTKDVVTGFILLPLFLILGSGIGVSSFLHYFYFSLPAPLAIGLSTFIPFVFWKLLLFRKTSKKSLKTYH